MTESAKMMKRTDPSIELSAAALTDMDWNTELLKKYPDAKASLLVDKLAAYHGLQPSQVFVGVGSDDVIAMSFMTFFNSDKPILFPDITYSFYDVWADMLRIPYEKKSLDDDYNIVKEDYIGVENGGIIFPNPNAPTGIALPLEDIRKILDANRDVVVIVDEAYVDFGAKSALPLLKKYDNLLVVQTFSKSRAMAGARVGFAIGSEKLINYLKDVKFSFNSYTMNLPSIRIGTASAEDSEYFRTTTGRIAATRERFKEELRKLGFEFPDSMSNFVFARHPAWSGEALQKELRARRIIVRRFNRPKISDYLRITIGTDEQMDRVVEALKEILGA